MHHIKANHGGFPENAAKSWELIPMGMARGSELIAALNRLSSVVEVLKACPNSTGWRSPGKGAGRRGWWIGNLGKRWVGTRAEVPDKLEVVGVVILVKNELIGLVGTATAFWAFVLWAALSVCCVQFFSPAKLSPTEILHSRHQRVLDASCSVVSYWLFVGHLSERTNDLPLGPSSLTMDLGTD